MNKILIFPFLVNCNSVGDYYWNHYSNQILIGNLNQRFYDNLEIAKSDCIQFSTNCAGVTKEQNGYTLRRELIFQSEPGAETWVKVDYIFDYFSLEQKCILGSNLGRKFCPKGRMGCSGSGRNG